MSAPKIYKKIPIRVNRPVTQVSETDKTKMESTISKFIQFFKSAHS